MLRVPRIDWSKVIAGQKLQFRQVVGPHASRFDYVDLPRPVVVYSYRQIDGGAEHRLMVLTAIQKHPVGAISQEDIEAEGFTDLKEFRRYWKVRQNGSGQNFRPLSPCIAYYLRPFDPATDPELMGNRLFEHLYGEYV